jgi:hypothetical protein
MNAVGVKHLQPMINARCHSRQMLHPYHIATAAGIAIATAIIPHHHHRRHRHRRDASKHIIAGTPSPPP